MTTCATTLACFLISHVLVWVIFLEIGNAYFTAFLNCTNVIERYSLPIFGGAIGFSAFTLINYTTYLLNDPTIIEVFFYLTSFITVIYLLIMAYSRINLLLGQFEGEDSKMILFSQRLLWISAGCLVYTFVSVLSWLYLKGIDQLSLDILTWVILDWLVYFNIILYFLLLLGALIYSKKINFTEVDVISILNILDSPK